MTTTQHMIIILAVGIGTLLTRLLPFLLFPTGKETPPFVRYLGDVLPGAVFSLLVIFCLKGVTLLAGSHGIPELLGIAVTIVLHLWKRQMLLSIAGGTICYMLLLQFVF